MALEAINDIKRAEDQAEKLIQEATVRAKEIIKNTKIMADEEYTKILESANLRKNEILEKAKKDGNIEAEPILNQGERDVQEIKNISAEKKNNAINLIVERIVKIHGNS
ncbi:ATPase [Clostridium sp. AL.422]|uniref:ATPase n=1 Tax=Clostridium TaxID=1485 RepID=UPI00293DD15A|nr:MULTISPECIES: ATPase [unclassified Clostridium]MDV4150945.1 ATPase [Clostridium sp. AL.422]